MIIQNEIIPTLFALNKETFENKLKLLEFSPKIHLDFMDEKFVEGKSIKIEEMKSILNFPQIAFQIHLMANNPQKYIQILEKLNIKKVLIQQEAFKSQNDLKLAIKKFKNKNFELFIVLNPSTSIKTILPFLELIDGIMLMSVWPGKEGQKFINETYSKIKEIKKIIGQEIPIQIDGGIKDTNAKKLITSGANILNVGSYISSSKTPQKNYEKLKSLIKI